MNWCDTVWVLVFRSPVFLMTPAWPSSMAVSPGEKCSFNPMQCFIIMCIVGIQWVVIGYSLAFGPDTGLGIIGNWTGPA